MKWDYEVKVPELDTSVFIIPGEHIKNGEERLVVLNRIAKSVVESVRGLHPVHVFVRAHKESRRAAAGDQDEQHGLEGGSGTRGGCLGERARRSRRRRGFDTFAFTISSTPSAAGCARRVCRSRIVRTCSGIAVVASRRTTPRRN